MKNGQKQLVCIHTSEHGSTSPTAKLKFVNNTKLTSILNLGYNTPHINLLMIKNNIIAKLPSKINNTHKPEKMTNVDVVSFPRGIREPVPTSMNRSKRARSSKSMHNCRKNVRGDPALEPKGRNRFAGITTKHTSVVMNTTPAEH